MTGPHVLSVIASPISINHCFGETEVKTFRLKTSSKPDPVVHNKVLLLCTGSSPDLNHLEIRSFADGIALSFAVSRNSMFSIVL
jgi:hypothetical protein